MSLLKDLRFVFFLIFITAFTGLITQNSHSQVIQPSGTSDRPSSQLVLWYDQDEDLSGRSSVIQVTNTHPTQPVEIHIQIYRNLILADNLISCEESDFNDVLTQNDTHNYNLSDENILLNLGEDGSESPIGNLENTKGFIVITPVVGNGDNSAISFQHLTGNTIVFETNTSPLRTRAFKLNSMGRDAVNYSTGEITPDGTVLDGVSNGFVLVQPEQVNFNINNFDFTSPGTDVFGTVDVIGIAFKDTYSNPGLGYSAEPVTNLELIPFLTDYEEDNFSCPTRVPQCFMNIGLNEQFPGSNLLLSDENLCEPVILPNFPDDPARVVGWSRIFIDDYNQFDNFIGLYTSSYNQEIDLAAETVNFNYGGADWMFAKGEETIVEPASESPCFTSTAIIGTPGDDIIRGTNEDDFIIGLGGDDKIIGFGGSDCIDGGSGRDTLNGGDDNDRIFGGDDSDVILGDKGDDEIDGNDGEDRVNGGQGTDSCINSEATVNCE